MALASSVAAAVPMAGPSAAPAPSPAGADSAFHGRYWFPFAGFVLTLLAALLPWAQVGELSFYPLWGDRNRFRIDDWFDSRSLDGLLVLGLSALGMACLLAQRHARANGRWLLATWAVCALLLAPVALMELVYVAGIEGANLGLGLVLLILGVLVMALPLLVPYLAHRIIHSEDYAGEGIGSETKPWE